jgi:hypothetical protein
MHIPASIPELEGRFTHEQLGLLLPAVNTEIRCLMLGVLAVEPDPISAQSVHAKLQSLEYDKFHHINPKNNLLKQAKSTIPNIFHVDQDTEEIGLDSNGVVAAALAGVLLNRLPRDSSVGLYRLIGGYRHTPGLATTGPSLRRMILNCVEGSPSGISKASVIDAVQSVYPSIPQGTVENQMKTAIDVGIVENHKGKLTIKKAAKPTVRAYKELMNDFATESQLRHEGLHYIIGLISGRNKDSRNIPYLAKRSIIQSGKSGSPKLEGFLAELKGLVEDGEVVSTSEIVLRTGLEPDHVYEFLSRMVRINGYSAPLARINGVKPGTSKVKERMWRKPTRVPLS